jgi:hypothetical protein
MGTLSQRTTLPYVLSVAIVAFTIVGCQPQASVQGRVTYLGRPLTHGNVKVMPADGIPRDALIATDGKYQFDDLPCGRARFIVSSTPPEMVDAMIALAQAERPPGETEQPAATVKEPDEWSELPAKFGDFEKSGLALELQAGSQTHDLELR